MATSKPKELKSELEASKQSLTIYYMLGVCSAQIPLYHLGKFSGLAYIYANTYTVLCGEGDVKRLVRKSFIEEICAGP